MPPKAVDSLTALCKNGANRTQRKFVFKKEITTPVLFPDGEPSGEPMKFAVCKIEEKQKKINQNTG